jgi:hypothetical protein
MPCLFRLRRPQPRAYFIFCLSFISPFSRFTPWAKTRSTRILGTLSISPSSQRSRLYYWERLRSFLMTVSPFRRTLNLFFCKSSRMSYSVCIRFPLPLPSPRRSVPLCIFPSHAFILRKRFLLSQIRMRITFPVLQVCISLVAYLRI